MAELHGMERHANERYAYWMNNHRQILRLAQSAMNKRDRYRRGTKGWINYNNELNRLVPKLNHCRDAADYWAGRGKKISAAIRKGQSGGNNNSGGGYWKSWDKPGGSTGASGKTTGTGSSGNSDKGLLMGV